jgi:hypothetical protein
MSVSSKKWLGTADRSASWRTATVKTSTFATDAAIRYSITGTTNPNNAFQGAGKSALTKSLTESYDATVDRAKATARSGGTITPIKLSQAYRLVVVPEVVPVETTYTHMWYGYNSTSDNWVYITSSSDDAILSFGSGVAGTVYISTDSGATFNQRSTGMSSLTAYNTNRASTTMLAGNGAATAISMDYGVTWSGITVGGTALFAGALGDTIVTASSSGPIYYSNNSGSTWNYITTCPYGGWVDAVGDSAGTTVFLANNSTSISGAGGLWKRASDSATFVRITTLAMATCDTAWCSADAATIWTANTSGEVYYSGDEGVTWTQAATGTTGLAIKQIRAGSDPVDTVYLLTDSAMYLLPTPFETAVEMSYPTLIASSDTSVYITNIYVDTASASFAKYTIYNGVTTSDYQDGSTYTDTDLTASTTYTYAMTYYTADGAATATIVLSSVTTIAAGP